MALFQDLSRWQRRPDSMAKFALLGLLDTIERATIRRQEIRDLEDQWRQRK